MRKLNAQRGMTLVSLMIGCVLSMLTILAMLALYKNLIQVAVVATKDANHDGQLASALLVAQLELQGAGFGLEGSASNMLYLPTDTPALLWRYRTDPDDASTNWCMGLLERSSSDGSRTLTLLKKSACSANLASLSLADETDTLKSAWQEDGVIDLATLMPGSSGTLLTIEQNASTNCNAYSSGDGTLHPQITLTAQSASGLASAAAGASITPISYRVCLSNISASS
ncbi:PilW family protein [Pseudomonas sp. LRF_L74]|uniref:PilW family protein n=1 Tax=Pseudomonas sp. LRF_L74 TaxID=3369422 RepID=UPI003F639ABD